MSKPFLVGDTDLILLGVAAGLAARYQALRKIVTITNDEDYQKQVLAGFSRALKLPIDDVPEVLIRISSDALTFQKMRELESEVRTRLKKGP